MVPCVAEKCKRARHSRGRALKNTGNGFLNRKYENCLGSGKSKDMTGVEVISTDGCLRSPIRQWSCFLYQSPLAVVVEFFGHDDRDLLFESQPDSHKSKGNGEQAKGDIQRLCAHG